uniref:Uncharacterized protein n=1 Tax=Kalanchoe fedtschenkoi TaxID=63787 RepID=A0A7N0TE85_KALFE
MDAYQRYNTNVRPPPPPSSTMDFQQDQLQHQHPPAPPQAQWYPGQNHYQPTSQPPPPPPGMQNPYPPNQWGPHPTENHAPQGYPPPPPQYPNQHYPPHQFPSPNRPHMHPPLPPPPYQEWGNPNWTHHQGYEYPVAGQSNQDDWAARARAWATAKAAMDNQQQQVPFPQGLRTELQTQINDQYALGADTQHLETKSGSNLVAYPHSSYGTENQRVCVRDGQSNNIPGDHQYGLVTFSSANHLAKDGSLGDESKATVHQQEVPSSYSSVAGREVGTNQNQLQFKSFPGPGNALQGGLQAHPMVPVVDPPDLLGRSFSYQNQSGDLSDKPLDFAPRANISSMYPHPDATGHHRGVESSATMPINHSWAPHLAPGNIYPLTANSGSQFDPSISTHSPVPGQVAPLFGTIPGPNFHPTLPSVSGSFGPGNGSSLVSPTTFSVDAYGASSSSDRPKKASVPNWLKEEIIKKKAVMATSTHEYHQEETQSMEYEMGNQPVVKDDQAESKSIDSSRSAEEEEDEDYVEAARTAAINKEIKRVLTEVLLKVTDDLFDEIATKVLGEEDITTDAAPSQPSPRVIVPDKSKGINTEELTGKTSSVLPGGLLGLASYYTDSDDEKDETNTQELSGEKPEKVKHGHSHDEMVDDDIINMKKMDDTSTLGVMNTDSINRRVMHEVASGANGNDRKLQNGSSSLDMMDNLRDKEQDKRDRTKGTSSLELSIASDEREAESKMSSRSSPIVEAVSDRIRENKKEDKSQVKYEEKHPIKGKSDDRSGSKDRKKDGSKIDEKQKDSTLRKRSHYDEEDRKELERGKRVGGREDKKREHLNDDKSERSRQKHSSNSNQHKRGRSPSPSRRKKNKSDSSISGGSSTNDESLDDSGRNSRSKRRPRSPSPMRSRKRQVSRSPEHSLRRHSPYYSLEASRRKRSSSPRRHR